ncbi:Amidohydrolase family [Nesidiocoris tenuis]|uniref:dihydropyrimidinase n=1 Tax=Nesidiocoris tenuis TaxID=355587 RepID=A0ABN7BDD5_9HEMI|nr:Amidohydrolase family [Nesidiocoris tenuis]
MAQKTKPILIRNGTVVNSDGSRISDVLIVDGKIADVKPKIADVPPGAKIVDASGMYVIPGGIDAHTHLDFEFMGTVTKDDFYHGTKAGVVGGTTMVIDFVIPKKGQSLIEALEYWHKKAAGKAVADYAFHMAVTWWGPQVQKEMEILCKERGINSFKMFMAYKDSMMIDDADLYNAFKKCESLGALPMVHAENGHIIKENSSLLLEAGTTGPEGHQLSRPENVEAEATNRACVIAENVGSSLYVVHVMSGSAAETIATRRKAGNRRIFGEALAAGLGTTFPKGADYSTLAAHVMGPPIREDPATPGQLMAHLVSDGLSTTGTDNCTFDKCQKEMGKGDFTKIPNGVNGLEDRMSIIWNNGVRTGVMTPERFVAVTSANAAKIFNIYPKKGAVLAGSDADLVVWNPDRKRTISATTHHHNNDFNIFEGKTVVGNAEVVIVRGRICFEASTGVVNVEKGWGEFVPTPCYSPEVFPKQK